MFPVVLKVETAKLAALRVAKLATAVVVVVDISLTSSGPPKILVRPLPPAAIFGVFIA
jgi:hypothetical protein